MTPPSATTVPNLVIEVSTSCGRGTVPLQSHSNRKIEKTSKNGARRRRRREVLPSLGQPRQSDPLHHYFI